MVLLGTKPQVLRYLVTNSNVLALNVWCNGTSQKPIVIQPYGSSSLGRPTISTASSAGWQVGIVLSGNWLTVKGYFYLMSMFYQW